MNEIDPDLTPGLSDTATEIKWAIVDADKPFMTVSDLADELGVSGQTIHDNKNELEDDWSIETDTVGQATVFYHRGGVDSWDKESANQDWRERMYGRRGMWLETVSNVKTRRRLKGEKVDQRIELWKALDRHPYDNSFGAYEPASERPEDYENTDEEYPEIFKWEHRVSIPPSANISIEEVRVYDQEIFLFESEWYGEVTGLCGLARFKSKVRSQLREKEFENPMEQMMKNVGSGDRKPLDEFDEENLDELVPTVDQIIAAGEAADYLFCELYGVEW